MTSERTPARGVASQRKHREVLTVLEPCMRTRVEIGAQGLFIPRHAASFDEAIELAQARSFHLLLVSPAVVAERWFVQLAQITRKAPEIEVVAVYGERTERLGGLLALGAQGVRSVCDLTTREGWGALRSILAEPDGALRERIWTELDAHSCEASEPARAFFRHVVAVAPRTATVRKLAAQLSVLPSTLMSRFYRARLPSPKRYLAMTRLLYASGMLENRAASVARVADQLDYSSPQSFGRHVRTVLGMSAGELRQYSFAQVSAHYVHELVEPFKSVLQTFEPCAGQAVGTQQLHG